MLFFVENDCAVLDHNLCQCGQDHIWEPAVFRESEKLGFCSPDVKTVHWNLDLTWIINVFLSFLLTACGRSWDSRVGVCRCWGLSGWCASSNWSASCRPCRDSWWCSWRPWTTWPLSACSSCSSSSSSGILRGRVSESGWKNIYVSVFHLFKQ